MSTSAQYVQRIVYYIVEIMPELWLYPMTVISSVVECLTRDRGAAGSSLIGVTVSYPWSGHINPSLVLV